MPFYEDKVMPNRVLEFQDDDCIMLQAFWSCIFKSFNFGMMPLLQRFDDSGFAEFECVDSAGRSDSDEDDVLGCNESGLTWTGQDER